MWEVGPEALAVVAGMLGVTLLAGSRRRARRRRTARAAGGWTPAVAAPATFATATSGGRWGEARMPAADFDDWQEEAAPRPATPANAPAPEPEPELDALGAEELDAVFSGRDPSGRFSQEPARLVPDARDVFLDAPPRGGAAGFRSAPRRTTLRAVFAEPAVRAAAYAAGGIALVALIVNLALAGEERAATPAPAPAATAQPPATPPGPTPAEIAAEREADATQRSAALGAADRAERRAVAAERRAIRRRRAAAAAARRRAAQPQPAPVTPDSTPPAPAAPSPSGGGSGGGNGGGSSCELGCIG